MDLEAPNAPAVFAISQDWVVAQSLYQHSSKPTQLRLQCQLPAAQGPTLIHGVCGVQLCWFWPCLNIRKDDFEMCLK